MDSIRPEPNTRMPNHNCTVSYLGPRYGNVKFDFSASVSYSDSDSDSASTVREIQRKVMVTYVSALFYVVGGIVAAGVALLVVFQEKLVYVPLLP
ncbi:unnamed protein product [Cochlearia groenlandica]